MRPKNGLRPHKLHPRSSIGFTGKDLEGIVQPHEDALVVTLALMYEEL